MLSFVEKTRLAQSGLMHGIEKRDLPLLKVTDSTAIRRRINAAAPDPPSLIRLKLQMNAG